MVAVPAVWRGAQRNRPSGGAGWPPPGEQVI
jgi:hypothetical protein